MLRGGGAWVLFSDDVIFLIFFYFIICSNTISIFLHAAPQA